MPCSCGNTTCQCGIPCYCLQESCKCQACAIALDRFCKVCKKPLITDIQTDEDACSCFVGESKSFKLENQDNLQFRMGNLPMPVGYFVYGKLIVNMIIPVPVLGYPQPVTQRPTSLMPTPLSIQTDSRHILPSFLSDAAIIQLSPREDSGISSPEELNQLLDKSNGKSSYQASSCIYSTSAQNTETSCKETCPTLILPSTDERKTVNVVQSTKSETEGRETVLEPSFYLPSIQLGNISYPVGLADQVWRLPNLAFSDAGIPNSGLNILNPFYVAGQVSTKCPQPDPRLNFVCNRLAQSESVSNLHVYEQPINLSNKTKHPDLEIHGEHVEFESSLGITTRNGYTFPSLKNSNPIMSTEQWKQTYYNNVSSNEILGNSFTYDKKLGDVSFDISSSGVQELSGVQPQPIDAISTSAAGKNCGPQARPIVCSAPISTGEVWQKNSWCSQQSPSTAQILPEHLGAPNTNSKFQQLFNKSNSQSSRENEYSQSGHSGPASVNNSIPLYLDCSTTQNMGKLLKGYNYFNASSLTLADLASMQNSDANNKFSSFIF